MNKFAAFFLLLILGWLVVILSLFTGMYSEERIGKYGKPFKLHKLRTMCNRVDVPESSRSNFFQRILRNSKIDELPQLLNILKGDMAFVGPRPLPVRYWSRIPESFKKRFDVLPGITGLVQVSGGNDLTWKQRFELDNEYIDKKSFRMDGYIVFRTLATVVAQKGPHLSEELNESDLI